MTRQKSVEDIEWDEGVKLKFGKGGIYDCMNCDWATNDKEKAERHRQFHIKYHNNNLPLQMIGFWKRLGDN